MIDAIRAFIEVHPVVTLMVALVVYALIQAMRTPVEEPRGDGLPPDWPFRRQDGKVSRDSSTWFDPQ